MEFTIQSKYNIGDKVRMNFIKTKYGIVIKVKMERNPLGEYTLFYLIEEDDETRRWHRESDLEGWDSE